MFGKQPGSYLTGPGGGDLIFKWKHTHTHTAVSQNAIQFFSSGFHIFLDCKMEPYELYKALLPFQDKSEDKPGTDEIECNEHRLLGLLDAACALIDFTISKGSEPHPSNAVECWQRFDLHLHPDDAKQISQSGNRVNCCFDAIFTTVHRGQMLGVYSSELASGMYELASNMFRGYKFCEMIVSQPSPAPFAVSWSEIL